MTPEKKREIIELYHTLFGQLDIKRIDYPRDKIVHSSDDALGHCHGMLDEISKFIDEGRKDQTLIWHGFVQGCLWTSKKYTLEDLGNHNSSD